MLESITKQQTVLLIHRLLYILYAKNKDGNVKKTVTILINIPNSLQSTEQEIKFQSFQIKLQSNGKRNSLA